MGTRFSEHTVVGTNSPVMTENLKRVIAFFDRSYLKVDSTLAYLDALRHLTDQPFRVSLKGDYNTIYESSFANAAEDEDIAVIESILSRNEQDGFIDDQGNLHHSAETLHYAEYQYDEDGDPIWGSEELIPYYIVGELRVKPYFPATREFI